MKRLFGLSVLMLLATASFSDVFQPPLNIEETDGDPSVYPYKLKVSPGTLTDNGDGTATLSTGGGTGTTGGTGGGSFNYLLLTDALSNKWAISVSTSGNLVSVSTSTIPSGSLYRTSIVTQDPSFGFWTITVSTSGNIVTTSGGTPSTSIIDILLNDTNNKTWIVTVNESGNLVTS